MAMSANYMWADNTWDTPAITSGTITFDGLSNTAATKSEKEPETALAWLDRRVDEMRLAL